MADEPLVYISILTWNRVDQTIACLRSLETLDYTNYRVVVVDNASQDDVPGKLGAMPGIILIQADRNHGYAGGHQLALERAQNDGAALLWILNNDLTVQPDSLRSLVDAHRANAMALYGSVPLEAEPIQDRKSASVQFPRKYLRLPFRQRLFPLRPFATYSELFPDQQIREVASLSGSSMLIPLPVIEQYGFMDTSYFLYLEEIDYCFRLREQGVPSLIVPTSLVFHRRGQSSAGHSAVRNIVTYYRTRNQLLFIRRYNHPRFFAWALVRNSIMMALLCITKGRAGVRSAGFILRGSLDGIRNKRGKTLAPEDVMANSYANATDHDRASS